MAEKIAGLPHVWKDRIKELAESNIAKVDAEKDLLENLSVEINQIKLDIQKIKAKIKMN